VDLQLSGKKALVTGSNTGIGKGIAAVLAREGAIVVVHGRNRERAEQAAAEITAAGGKAFVALGDLTTDEGAASVIDAVNGELGGLDILVNNAGGNDAGNNVHREWFDVPVADWLYTYQENTISAVRLIHGFVPGMRERGWGRVINIGTAVATQPFAQIPDYSSAKAGMLNMTVSLSKALAHTGVTVNSISPGSVWTNSVEEWLTMIAQANGWEGGMAEWEVRLTREVVPISVSQIGRPEEFGHLVVYLASPHSRYITGANYRMDGGQCQSIN
jgi:3-oxoacyl-[acyl-carrier protein] reductase